ncbi:hypothetical protein HMPREF3158_08875 [Corynebacterium sp. HMSC06G04]|uniref:hypothetical protein n=1 Tax=Corynebacterium sp. HMSC06G04 TaxID=1581126 RepID=UPI0008A2E258|nr:hypothetical protein [Corynebacterium sp. HMSC06G04]OFT46108.1 hypothetical protein HMPREF3158_08875 [Corynebacterium sp. HMSC06G04]
MSIREFPFGFYFGKSQKTPTIPNFEQRSINAEFELGVRNETQVQISNRDTVTIVVIGIAYDVGRTEDWHSSIADSLIVSWETGEAAFHSRLDTLAGRYTIFVVSDSSFRVYHDALGMSSTYINASHSLVCSHIDLGRRVCENRIKELPPLEPSGQHYRGTETPDPNYKALLPNFYFDSASSAFNRFYPRGEMKYSNKTLEFRMSRGEELVRRSVVNLEKQGLKLYAALTAGSDSRLVTAAFRAEDIPVSFVTYGQERVSEKETPTELSYQQDILCASRIAKDLGLTHIKVLVDSLGDFRALTQEESSILNRNSTKRHARNFQIVYEEMIGNRSAVMAVAPGLESWIDYFSSSQPGITPKQDWEACYLAVAGLVNEAPEIKRQALEKAWNDGALDLVKDYEISLSNLVFWEIRCGRFQSEAINSQSTAFLPINPLGIRELIEIANTLPFTQRKSRRFHRELIQRLFAPLDAYPYNGVRSIPDTSEIQTSEESYVDSSEKGHSCIRFTVEDSVSLTSDTLCKGDRVYKQYVFPLAQGAAEIVIENGYALSKATKAVAIFVEVDDGQTIRLDIGWSSEPRSITVSGLQRGQLIKIGVEALTNLGRSWIAPSRSVVKSLRVYGEPYFEEPKILTNDRLGEISNASE